VVGATSPSPINYGDDDDDAIDVMGHDGEVDHGVDEDSGRRLDSNANRCSDDDQHLLPPLGADDKRGWHRRRGLSVAEADTGSAVEVASSCYCVCRRPPRRRRRRISGLADFLSQP